MYDLITIKNNIELKIEEIDHAVEGHLLCTNLDWLEGVLSEIKRLFAEAQKYADNGEVND